MTKCAIFDWNGTLLDDMEINHISSNATLKLFDMPDQSFEEYTDRFTFPILHFYKRSGVPVDLYLQHAEEAGVIFIKEYESRVEGVKLRSGAIDILKQLRANDVHVMLLSNYMQDKITPMLEKFDIAQYFSHVNGNTCSKAILSGLNKQERLEAHMETQGLKPEDSFIIGDSLEEIDIARNLGMTGISIAGGCISTDRLRAHNPNYLVESLEELPKILQGLWGLNA